MIPPCLTLCIIRYRSRIKWVNSGKGVAPSPTLWCSSNRKGSLRVTLVNGRQLYLLLPYFKIYLELKKINTTKMLYSNSFIASKKKKKSAIVTRKTFFLEWRNILSIRMCKGNWTFGEKRAYFIIIMTRCQQGSPWLFLAIRPYRSSLPGGLQSYILYQHRAVVYWF